MHVVEPLLQDELVNDPGHWIRVRAACPACGETRGPTLCDLTWDAPETAAFRAHPSVDFYGFLSPLMRASSYQVRECGACGLLWQVHVLTPEAEQRFYSELREEHEPGVRTAKWPAPRRKLRYYTGVLELVSQLFPLFPDRAPESLRVLDFGAGWGYLGNAARALGHRVDAAEIHPAKRSHLAKLGFDCVELPSDRRWDAIVADQVFEHLADPATVLRLLRDHLRPGGCLLIAVPILRHRDLAAALRHGDLKTMLSVYPFLHVNMFSRAALLALGRGAELVPVWPTPVLDGRLDRVAPRLVRRLDERGRQLARRALAAVWPSAGRLYRGVQAFRLPE